MVYSSWTETWTFGPRGINHSRPRGPPTNQFWYPPNNPFWYQSESQFWHVPHTYANAVANQAPTRSEEPKDFYNPEISKQLYDPLNKVWKTHIVKKKG